MRPSIEGVSMTEETAESAPEAPKRPRRLGPLRQWPLVLVLLGLAGSLFLVMVLDYFRPGAIGFGGTLLFAGLLRLFLPDWVAGLLVVRARLWDAVTFFILGGGVLALALVIPEIG